jgi:epoxyqueuosine reductase
MVEGRGSQTDEDLARPRLGLRRVLVAQDLRPTVLVYPNRLHEGTISHMRANTLASVAEELGLDVIGAAPVAPYEETERHIRERRERGLFADMRFTMARPEESCHPETLLVGARSVVSAALCYWADGEEPPPGHGRLPRYTWWDAYTALRERLDELGRRISGLAGKAAETSGTASQATPQGDYRVLVDANQHVDREAAARSGVGFYGKNTMLITRRFGSWVVLGTLITTAELEPTPPLDTDCGSCTLCIEACPTGALDEPGVLDATRCLSYLTQSADPFPEEHREALGDRVYGCDICQDVCPWNRGVEKRRAGQAPPPGAEPHVSLVDWLEAGDDELASRYDRLFVPRNDPRFLRRNALVALGNSSGDAALARRYAEGNDELLREHAEWALARIGERA